MANSCGENRNELCQQHRQAVRWAVGREAAKSNGRDVTDKTALLESFDRHELSTTCHIASLG
jgi:hypothetical protein